MISGEFTLSEMSDQGASAKVYKPKGAAARIEALKAAGVDTSNYFPMGEEMVVKVVDGVPVMVDDDDPVYTKIASGGYINHYKLFRRWVMAQMFHILRNMKSGKNFNQLLQERGYEYQWRMVEDELRAQMKMHKHGDMANFTRRNQWFNGSTISVMASDYLNALKDYVEGKLMYRLNSERKKVYKHTCKGVPYVRIGGKNIFVSDLNKKLYDDIRRYAVKFNYEQSPRKLYELVCDFNKHRKRLVRSTNISGSFINAYKGSGAYFTMRNLIMFHGARFTGLNEKKSLDFVESKASEYVDEGWRMIGVMKKLIEDSGIDVERKIAEWRKK